MERASLVPNSDIGLKEYFKHSLLRHTLLTVKLPKSEKIPLCMIKLAKDHKCEH